ncbi:hypothetical protein EI982_09490 [Haloplanus rallus]|uniref:Uncharacterized protein n=1 Tax=Haloplanus rallus TaxID=1816183 RepID=A0A6B9F931_9EURY|nr:hypothetical protein [Haloplanus rallus]QGX95007.1 hypothetical protein EI982_09490 [Haloplanus rallus]
MATNQSNDNGMIAVIASLAAVGAVIYAVVGGGDTVQPIVDIPEGFGSSESSDNDELTDVPGISEPDASDPTSGDWQYEDPADNPNNPGGWDPDDYDFGGPNGGSGGSDSSSGSTDDGINWGGDSGDTTFSGSGGSDSGGSGSSDPLDSGSSGIVDSIGQTIPGVSVGREVLGRL